MGRSTHIRLPANFRKWTYLIVTLRMLATFLAEPAFRKNKNKNIFHGLIV